MAQIKTRVSSMYLERHEPDQNMHRFYVTDVYRDMLGAWIFLRRWGRVGAREGQSRTVSFETQHEAKQAETTVCKAKARRGYQRLSLWARAEQSSFTLEIIEP